MFTKIWRNKYLIHSILKYNYNNYAEIPANIGYFTVLKYRRKLVDRSTIACIQAAKAGHLSIVEWLWNSGIYDIANFGLDYPVNEAVKAEQLHVVDWFYSNTDAMVHCQSVDYLASHGKLNSLKWLWDNYRIRCSSDGLFLAVKNDWLATVEWLLEKRINDFSGMGSLLNIAVEGNNYKMVESLCNYYELDTFSQKIALEWAVWYNFIPIAELLWERIGNLCLCESFIRKLITLAEVNRQPEMVKWLHKKMGEYQGWLNS